MMKSPVKLNFTYSRYPSWQVGNRPYIKAPAARGVRSRENKMVDPPPKTTRSRISLATQATPWQEPSLTPYGDNSLNLVLSLSKDGRLKTAGNQFNGRPFDEFA